MILTDIDIIVTVSKQNNGGIIKATIFFLCLCLSMPNKKILGFGFYLEIIYISLIIIFLQNKYLMDLGFGLEIIITFK